MSPNTRAALAGSAGVAAGFLLAVLLAALRPAPPAPAEPLAPGTLVVVHRPTGEVVPGTGGTAHRRERIVLRVFRSGTRVLGRENADAHWTLEVGGAQHAAERVE